MAEEITKELIETQQQQEEGEEGKGKGRYILAIAGCPGSGKSTLSKRLCNKIKSRGIEAVVVPMDGFHYYRKELDQMLNPELAHKRRGAHWTFDSEAFVDAVLSVSEPNSEASFPSFDHAIGDPAPGEVVVTSEHQVVIVEGLYLFLDVPPWNKLLSVYDKKCFIRCPIGLALKRVMHRKVHTLGMEEKVAKNQVEQNDKKNAITVWKSRNRAEFFIPT